MATVKKELTKLTPQLMSYVEKCSMNTTIDPELYTKYNVKRGLRDVDGKGVVAGLTEISEINAFLNCGESKIPCEGELYIPFGEIKAVVENVEYLVAVYGNEHISRENTCFFCP